MNKTIVEVKNLTKKFSSGKKITTAVDNISFSIKEGEIVGLLGPNGAGKTTTIRMLLSLLIPDAGIINIFGKNLLTNREEILSQLNFTFVGSHFGSRLTVAETLKFYAMLYEVKDLNKRITEVLSSLNMNKFRNKQMREISSGEISQIMICKALVNRPKLLLLDEPTASLDPDTAQRVRDHIKIICRKYLVTILYTSHNMYEVEEMCNRIIFLSRGKIIISGTPLAITQKIIRESAKEPSLKEVFIKISRGEVE